MAGESFEVTLRVNLDAGNLSGQLSSELGRVKGQYSQFDSEIQKVQKSLDSGAAAQQRFAQGLSTTRYALYDVSSTLAAVSAAALAFAAGSTAVAVAWERDFAQVIRTTQVAGDEITSLREDLVGLAQTMPVAFGDITQIATLAGQLGIAKEQVASFTETVAKFSAISDVSVEAAATAFGRLDSLLPDVQGNFDALGSSIAKVAVESVSTESQIISIATQIAGMGAFAGLTADQVVGLSGALASVGTQPELSRGLVTRLFVQMSDAITEGGDRLEAFGRISGTSGAEFAAAFGTDKMGPMLEAFILGLGDVERTGGNAVQALEELGITSVRDVPALLRLAQASDVVTKAFDNAAQGFDKGTELNRQYGIIAETTAAKLQILANNFQAFLAAIGGSTTGPLSAVADYLSEILRVATALVASPLGQWIAGFAVGAAALVAAVTGLGAAAAVGFAGIIAMQQALVGLTGSAGAGTIGLAGLQAQLIATGTAGTIASKGISAAIIGIKGLGLALAGLAAIAIGSALTKWAGDISYSLKGLESDAGSAFDRLLTSGEKVKGFFSSTDLAGELNRAFAPLSNETVLRDIAAVDEALSSMVRSGNANQAREMLDQLRTEFKAAGIDSKDFNTIFTDTIKAMRETSMGGELGTESFSNLGAALDQVEADAQEAKAALDALRQAVLDIGNANISMEQASIAVAQALNEMNDAANAADVSLDGTNDASLRFRSTLIGVETSARVSALAMLDNGKSVDEATAAYNAGRTAIINAIAAKTGDISAAAQWADAILGSASDAQAGIAAYAGEVQAVPETKDTELTNNGPEAGQSLRAYINEVEGVPASKTTEMINNAPLKAGEVGSYTDAIFRIPTTQVTVHEGNAVLKAGEVGSYTDAIFRVPGSTNTTHNNNAPGAQGQVQSYINTINSTPTSRNTTLQNNAQAAAGTVWTYISAINSIPTTRTTTVNTIYTTSGAGGGGGGGGGFATGGPIYGPGTKTSDSIPILASAGEYMMRASAVDKYGLDFMNAVNSGRIKRFAEGGPVSTVTASSSPMVGIMELGPKSLSAIAREVAVNIMLDDEAISRSAQRGDQKRRLSGDL